MFFFGVEKSWFGVEKYHWRQHTFWGEVDLLGTVATMVEIDVYPPILTSHEFHDQNWM